MRSFWPTQCRNYHKSVRPSGVPTTENPQGRAKSPALRQTPANRQNPPLENLSKRQLPRVFYFLKLFDTSSSYLLFYSFQRIGIEHSHTDYQQKTRENGSDIFDQMGRTFTKPVDYVFLKEYLRGRPYQQSDLSDWTGRSKRSKNNIPPP